jgi:TM2 domain-containing membrane protein YozV
MKKAVKGALWSGLVFPGFGQLIVKRPVRGIVFIVATSVTVSMLAERIIVRVLAAVQEITASGEPLDMVTIVSASRRATAITDSLALKLLVILAALLWAVSVIDAFVIGRKRDVEEVPAPSDNPGPPAA